MFDQIDYWHWWVFAIVLIILETFAPGAFGGRVAVAAQISATPMSIIGSDKSCPIVRPQLPK